MARETLVDFFADVGAIDGTFLVHDDGYRTRDFTYRDIGALARAFAARLRAEGFGPGDSLIIWSENRPEWIVALWGALLESVVLVPVDFRASADALRRIAAIVKARAILVGGEVSLPSDQPFDTPVWPVADLASDRATRASVDGSPHRPTRDTTAEIIFTSGATADPKGVVITHRNLLANIVPIEREIHKYRKYGRPFFPLRFLNLLPLSHMFGQAMATFVPPMLPGEVVFMHGFSPEEIVRQVRSRRISVVVCVPKILDVLREFVVRRVPEAAAPLPHPMHWTRRWWHYRRVHRLLGWKFWAFVVGAAPLTPELEEFWGRLGYVVIQGYGLTETAPIVTLNHPFHTRRGTVGKPIVGVEVRIAPDGEILVRGDNVTTGYYHADAETRAAFEDGWFHTGDVGEVDEEGRLFIKGRKKEMIVTPEGLNVYPDDVERVLDSVAGVRESAVVGIATLGQERVHAVVVLEAGAAPEAVVREANRQLEDHQKVRGISRWPHDALPRTEGTRKLKRAEIRKWASGETPAATGSTGHGIDDLIARFAGRRTVGSNTTIDELGLSSLERLELLMALEDRFQTTLDEGSFSQVRSVGELRALVERPLVEVAEETVRFPTWNRRVSARTARRLSLPTWILPLTRIFARIRVEGREHLRNLPGPVVFAVNHQSHLDTPVVLAALPSSLRYRVAPAMSKEFFEAHFFPGRHTRREWLTNSLTYGLAALFFNAFPLPQREAGTRQTLRYIGELIAEGQSILLFPEGRRSETGEIGRFMPGVGMIASRLDVPVVPVRIDGLDRVLHPRMRMARPGRVRVVFGAPLRLQGDDHVALAGRVEAAVRGL